MPEYGSRKARFRLVSQGTGLLSCFSPSGVARSFARHPNLNSATSRPGRSGANCGRVQRLEFMPSVFPGVTARDIKTPVGTGKTPERRARASHGSF